MQVSKKPKASEVIGYQTTDVVNVTEKMVINFAEVSGDNNPIHVDAEFAKTTRFGQRIAHGMLIASFISKALAHKLPGRGGVYLGQTLKFVHPVFIGDTVTIELKILNYREEKGIAVVETNVKKQTGEFVIKGEATVMLGDSQG